MGIKAKASSILAIPKGYKEMQTITPYSDETMTYDRDMHQYVLTIGYVKEKLGIDLPSRLNTAPSDDPQMVAQYRLEEVSNEIYSYIYAHSNNNAVQEYFACKLESTRVVIRKAMLEQLAYECISGAISQFSGVNVKTGHIMDRKGIEKAVIGFNAKKVLDSYIPEIGCALTYQGHWASPIGIDIRGDY